MIFCIRIKLRMNIHHVLFFCFLSALQDGNTGLVNAINLFAGAEGGSGLIICHLTSSGSTKFFCKGKCKEEDILIKTDDVTAQSGRYSIKYKDGSSGRRTVTVTFTQLTKSDSGRYRCGLGGSSVPDAYTDFDITVIDAATLGDNTRFIRAGTVGGNITKGCIDTVNVTRKFFCKDECKKEEDILVKTEENRAQNGRYSIEYREGSTYGLYLTITQLKKSDTGRYRCGYGRASSPDSSDTFQIFVVDAPTTSKPNRTLRPFPTSVPSASTPTTTQSLISSSGSFTPSSYFPETTKQFTAPTTSKPNRTLQPFPTSVPSASTPTTTQSLISSSGSFTPSSSFPETTEQFTAATLGQNTSSSRAETVGGSVTQECLNTVYGSRKFFCKDECKKEEDILVDTEENRAQNGRYNIEYREGSVFGLYVTITQLKKSDTGRYSCGYGRASSPDSSYTFSIFVVDAPTTSKPNRTLRPFPTSVPSASTPTTTQSLISSSGSFTPSSSFPETTEQFTDSYVPQPGYFLPPAVIVPVIVVLLAVVLLLLYKLKTRRNSDLNTRGTSDSRNIVVTFNNNLSVINENRPVINENCPPVSSCEDNVYQNLDPDSSDPDQNYSALTANK
ncbi:polymeric immunoglobulin receptor-like isoform X9 [Thunnus maccoyii]|uniref:polymeric immunoglobulin receptor-like isoform X9 n=1 Tax=Thunnus maccoyii TaxID=8240 RepID=UPI001C4CE76B|nr:polymeric immunoglobulin receptor-like isoform X9 [Thunnus maccoyii]XP_042265575.1 polymeric immunoglobulin receptor-like isoform X9 [Thunnus maccoyii]